MTTDNSRADALTRESIEAIARKYAGSYFSGLLFQSADSFARFSDELIAAAPPLEQHEAAPAEKNTPIERLMDEYRGDGFNFTDIEGVKRCALRYVQTMPDSQVRTLLYALAAQPEPLVADERAAFEAKFKMPPACERCGDGYVATEYNAWDAHKFVARWEGWKARASSPNAAGAEGVNDVTLDRRDLFDFARGAIKSALEDYKIGEGMTQCWYWQEATTRAEALLEALDTKSPYIDAPAQAAEPVVQWQYRVQTATYKGEWHNCRPETAKRLQEMPYAEDNEVRALYAAPPPPAPASAQVALPALTDAMREIITNEAGAYQSADDLYAALCDAAGAERAAPASVPVGLTDEQIDKFGRRLTALSAWHRDYVVNELRAHHKQS